MAVFLAWCKWCKYRIYWNESKQKWYRRVPMTTLHTSSMTKIQKYTLCLWHPTLDGGHDPDPDRLTQSRDRARMDVSNGGDEVATESG